MRAADVPREHYALAFRLLHGCLYVGAFLCHIGVLPPAAACCPHPSCAAAEPPPLDGLTHSFLTCPAVEAAAGWVAAVFAAVSGGAPPPLCPRVFLADETSVWAPPPPLAHLWTHLRLAYLHAVWRLRARRSLAGEELTPVAVCGATVAAVRAAIRRDFTRATRDLRRLGGTYAEWFRGRDASIQVGEFLRRWAHGDVLCRVTQGGLQLHFSLALPVAVPGAPAAEPGERAPRAAPAAAAVAPAARAGAARAALYPPLPRAAPLPAAIRAVPAAGPAAAPEAAAAFAAAAAAAAAERAGVG